MYRQLQTEAILRNQACTWFKNTNGTYKGVGGWEGWGGWAFGGRLTLSLKHRQPYCVFSKWHKQSQCIGQAETVFGYSLAPHTSLLMPFSGSTGPVVHLNGLTGLKKVICGSRLGYLYQYAWCAWTATVQERIYVAFMLSYKLDFSCCANKDGFCKSSYSKDQ